MSVIFDNADVQNVILTVLACVVLAVILGCVYTFIRAIFFFIFSGTKEENKKKGWNSIRFMIIGLVMTILLLFLVSPVLSVMNVQAHAIYTSRNILGKAGEVLNYVFTLGNAVKESQQNNEYQGKLYYDTTPDLQPPSSAGYQL